MQMGHTFFYKLTAVCFYLKWYFVHHGLFCINFEFWRHILKYYLPWLLSFSWCSLKIYEHPVTLCDPIGYSLSGSSAHGILQARILEWVVMPSLRGSSHPRDWTCFSYVSCISWLFFTTNATREAYIYVSYPFSG